MSEVYKTRLFLGLILVTGAVLRLYGIDFGLPELIHPDEPFEIHRALRLATGSFDLSRAGKGGFYFIVFLELAVSFVVLFLLGVVSTPEDFAFFFVSNEDSFYLMARITSALIGVACLYIVYKIGYERGGKIAGLTASFLLAVSSLHIANSHFATVDITLVFFLLLTWLFLLRFAEKCERKNLYLSSLFAGLSTITKLPGILIIIPIGIVCIRCMMVNAYLRNEYLKCTLVAVVIFLVVMFAGQPGYINTFKNLGGTIEKLYYKSPEKENSDGLASKPEHINLYRMYANVIVKDLGFPVITLFLVSTVYFLWHGSMTEMLILSFIIPFYISISSTTAMLYYDRYVLPITPLIILISARGVGRFYNFLENRPVKMNASRLKKIYALCLILLFHQNILSGVDKAMGFTQIIPRVEAKKWFHQNVTSGAKILMEGSPEHRSQLLVPLVDTDANIQRMIKRLEHRDPGKAFYWKLRTEYLGQQDVPRYDLKAIQNTDPWINYFEFKNSKLEYVLIDSMSIDAYKQSTDVISISRIRFYKKLTEDPEVIKVREFSNIVLFKKKHKLADIRNHFSRKIGMK